MGKNSLQAFQCYYCITRLEALTGLSSEMHAHHIGSQHPQLTCMCKAATINQMLHFILSLDTILLKKEEEERTALLN